eukprot:Skav204017  [mRNA]  locus=scaffold229:13262:15010:- [translate_table: standard]
MAFLGCVECGKNLVQNEVFGLVIANGFHEPIEDEDDANQSIQLSASKEYFEKFVNENNKDDETNVSLSAEEWESLKAGETLYFDEDEDEMRSDFVNIIKNYKASVKADQWVSECQCPQCRVLQMLVLERAYIIKNGIGAPKDEGVKIEVSEGVMERIYFDKYYGGVGMEKKPTFKKREWEAILDKWEDFKVEWQYHLFHYHCDVRHGLIDAMWSAIGIPVRVICHTSFFQTALDIRICGVPLKNVEIDDLREAVWSEIGDELMENGWRQEELFFIEFKLNREERFNGNDLIDDEELQELLNENPNLELVLIDVELDEDIEEESNDGAPVSILVRQMFEPYITKEQEEWNTNTITEFKGNYIVAHELDLELDDLRVVWQDRDLEDFECWDELGYGEDDTINVQVFIRGRGGGKRKFEDVMEEVNDKVVKIASKMSADNQFKPELDELFRKLESNSSGTPITDIVRNMNPDEFQGLYGNYWNDTQANFLRFVPNIAENLTPLMNRIVKTERDASDAKQALCATLCGFFATEFNNGKEVKNSIFEDILENQKAKHEEDQRVEARAQQLVLERQNASNGGDALMTG